MSHSGVDVTDSSEKGGTIASDQTNPSYPWQTNPVLFFSHDRFPGDGFQKDEMGLMQHLKTVCARAKCVEN